MGKDTAHFRNDSTNPIAIVGGGLGGLALAIGLLKHDIRVHIYEAAAGFSEIGAGVAFALNSTRALSLIDERLLDGYKKHATYNDDPERGSTFLQYRWGQDERREGGSKAGDLMWNMDDVWNPEAARKLGVKTRSCIHRARLLDELVALIPEGITTFKKSFESADVNGDGTISLHFADGTTARASAMIGCDGVKSKSRKLVCGPDIQPSYNHEYAFRAMVPREEIEKVLGKELALNGQLYCGYGAYIVTYPVEHHKFTNMVAIPREAKDFIEWNNEDWTTAATKEEFNNAFQDWRPELIELIGQYCQPVKWAIFHLQHNAPYYRGRICLLGDSAHATSPHIGAGAGMAMEDAFVLSHLIAAVSGPTEIERAFRAYDEVRRPRTQKLVEYSRLHGLAINFVLEGISDDTEKLHNAAGEWYRWLWHGDIVKDLEDARKLL